MIRERASERRVQIGRRRAGALVCVVAAGAIALLGGHAMAQMPDARSMSGVPRPVGDLPAGTVSVRLVRDELTNVVARHRVELLVDGRTQTAETDDSGRAEFSGLPPGATVTATATLDGARVQSESFRVPTQGGVRVLLVGGAAGRGPSAAGAPTEGAGASGGSVVLGGNTRVIVEFAEDELEVFYLLDVLNSGSAPLAAGPLVFDLPSDAQGAGLLEGSSPQAVIEGRRLVVSGPFQPGLTTVHLAYYLPLGRGSVRLQQQLPAALSQLNLLVQKVGNLRLTSQAVSDQRETADGGRTLVVASGPGIPAGGTLDLTLDGLPHYSTWPVRIALALAGLILGAGAWSAATDARGAPADSTLRRLESRREQLLSEVSALDQDLRLGRVDGANHSVRRRSLIGELERVYRALDAAGVLKSDGAETPGR